MENDIPLVYQDLREYLRNEHNGKPASGGKETIIRCFFCGDSKDIRDAHLYVGLNKKRNNTICYNCFKCGTSGFVDNVFFRELNCYDLDLIGNVLNYNKERLGESYTRKKRNSIIKPVITYDYTVDINMKTQYFNNRLGVHCTPSDLLNLKVIFGINNFLHMNYIRETTRDERVIAELDRCCIGFLSVDNTYIIERKILESNAIGRYTNYKIFGNRNDCSLYYVVPGIVNTYRDIHIHIAEGAFDILGVYFNVIDNKDNCIFMSSGNKSSFKDAILYIISRLKLVSSMININVYLDKEDNGQLYINKYRYQLSEIKPYVKSIIFHYNGFDGEKDFGIVKERIIDNIL